MDPMEDQICVLFQMGVFKEHVNFDRATLDLDSLREKARIFVEKHCPNQKIPQDRILLFRHNYESQNMLNLIQNDGVDGINNGTVIEAVISNKNERPAYPHILNMHNYLAPTFCDYCGEILVGLVKQGLKCARCNLNFHKKCAFAAHNNCSAVEGGGGGVGASSPGGAGHQQHHQQQQQHFFGLPHTFVVHTYKKPTVCKVCNNLLVGIVKQGLQCRDCKVNVHKKCASALPFDCRTEIGFGGIGGNFLIGATNSMSSGVSSGSGAVTFATSTPEAMDVESLSTMHSAFEERLSTGELIQLARIPGQAAIRHSRNRASPTLMEGWLLHFTNHNATKRRHYWLMDSAGITLHHTGQPQGTARFYKHIPLADILGVRSYDGPPLDPSGPPHCFEIQTAATIYYVGENLDWYVNHVNKNTNAIAVNNNNNNAAAAAVPQLPRRESGVGTASANKWLTAIRQALLPPMQGDERAAAAAAAAATGTGGATANSAAMLQTEISEDVQLNQQIALEFSQLYQFNQQEELGSGQFGTVYGGVHRSTGRRVAVKVILKSRFGRKQKEQLRSEVAILQNISYPGIITLEAMFETRDRIFVVMEKMDGDMLEMILSNRMGRLTERVTKFLIIQILKALKYLHSQDIAHCDLKPENVLLNSAESDFPQTKLCDFGYARIIGENTFRKTVVGTPAYLAPEVLQKRGYNKSLDMWSVGVVIYVTLSGTFPFNEGEEISEQIQNAAFMYPPNPWSEVSRDAIDLISKLLRVNIEERLTIDDCFEHPWVSDTQMLADLKGLEAQLGMRYLTTEEEEMKLLAISNP